MNLLAPYRVLDLTDVRGQIAGMMLGDLGADVVRVEPTDEALPMSDESGQPREPDAGTEGVEPLREALDGLRREIRSRFPQPGEAASALSDVDWMELFQSLRRRANALGMSERSGEVDEFGMDEVVVRQAGPGLTSTARR